MATNEETENFIPPFDAGESDSFPTREQLNDKSRPNPLDFDEPDSSQFDVISTEKSPTPKPVVTNLVDESDSSVIQDLAKRAKGLGMNDDEIEAIKDTGALRSVIAALQRQATTESINPTSSRNADADESPSSEYDALTELDPDDAIDPSAIKAIKALKAELDKVRARPSESGSTSRPDEADYMIAKLGEDYVDVFGDGPSHSLSPRSEEYKARAVVVSEMQRIRELAKSAKKRIPDSSEAFDQAVRSVFGSKVKQMEQRSLVSKVKQRESQLIARPANNGKRPVTGREKAIASVSAMMRDRMSGS